MKIRPENRCKVIFAVSGLPYQKITGANLAASPDDKVNIGKTGGVEILAEQLFIYVLRWQAVSDKAAHRFQYLRATTVIEGNTESHTGVFLGEFHGPGYGLSEPR